MANRFYVSVSGGNVQGPFEIDEIRARVDSGEYGPATQVCPEGTEKWSLLSASPAFGGPGSQGPLPPHAAPPMSAPPAATAIGPPASYVGPVLATIFCCLIFGIVTLVFTSKANTARSRGDRAKYEVEMEHRKAWMMTTIVLGGLFTGPHIVSVLFLMLRR